MAKKESFGAKPVEKNVAIEQWVEGREPLEMEESEGPLKRLTNDPPASLAKLVQTSRVRRGVKMENALSGGGIHRPS
jgi:hypothetical protein